MPPVYLGHSNSCAVVSFSGVSFDVVEIKRHYSLEQRCPQNDTLTYQETDHRQSLFIRRLQQRKARRARNVTPPSRQATLTPLRPSCRNLSWHIAWATPATIRRYFVRGVGSKDCCWTLLLQGTGCCCHPCLLQVETSNYHSDMRYDGRRARGCSLTNGRLA